MSKEKVRLEGAKLRQRAAKLMTAIEMLPILKQLREEGHVLYEIEVRQKMPDGRESIRRMDALEVVEVCLRASLEHTFQDLDALGGTVQDDPAWSARSTV